MGASRSTATISGIWQPASSSPETWSTALSNASTLRAEPLSGRDRLGRLRDEGVGEVLEAVLNHRALHQEATGQVGQAEPSDDAVLVHHGKPTDVVRGHEVHRGQQRVV